MNKRKIFKYLAVPLLAIAALSGCGEKKEEPMEVNYFMEKDYVYMWHMDGIGNDEDRVAFQTEQYGMIVDSLYGKMIGLGHVKQDKYQPMALNSVDSIETFFEFKETDKYVESIDIAGGSRIIDSGRNFNRLDNVSIRFKGLGTKYYGRAEYIATPNYLAFNYGLQTTNAGTYGMRFSFVLSNYTLSAMEDSRGIKAVDGNGDGFLFIKQDKNDDISLTFENSTICVQNDSVVAEARTLTQFGILIVPFKGNDMSNYESVLANESATLTAFDKDGNALPVTYKTSDGAFFADMNSISGPSQQDVTGRTTYNKVDFKYVNNTKYVAKPVICFNKTSNVSITGLVPMILDSESGQPTGEQVQISKNWHTFSNEPAQFNYADPDSPIRLWQGPWVHCYSWFSIEGQKTLTRKFNICFGQWGDAFSASHAQLCLIGWGGNQVWDQSALGSWGESVCYDPDICCGRSQIDDVRPFLVTAPTGGNRRYSWSGNVGGADFLNYIEDSEQRIINRRITYITHGPNLTNVNYSGVTSNGKIKSSVTINLGRTDDVVRNYYTLEYQFLEDASTKSLSFFKMGADGYADNLFMNYAYGNGSKIIEKDKSATITIEDKRGTCDDDFWFGLYSSSDNDEYGDTMFTVRSFDATLNKKNYKNPDYILCSTFDGTTQAACEIVTPNEVGEVIKKGSTIKMVIEFTILPNNTQTYYGQSDYIVQSSDIMGTGEAQFQQVSAGHINVKATKGNVKSSYPVRIESANNEAEFELTGGLGLVPVAITNLDDCFDYVLQVKDGNDWVDVDQSVRGNDFWQCYKDASTGKYELTFNVKNTKNLDFNIAHQYRLVKGGK